MHPPVCTAQQYEYISTYEGVQQNNQLTVNNELAIPTALTHTELT